jgi:hypothetical protein
MRALPGDLRARTPKQIGHSALKNRSDNLGRLRSGATITRRQTVQDHVASTVQDLAISQELQQTMQVRTTQQAC